MSKLRILIVDDESLARARVRSFLRDHPSVEIAGECENGLAALDLIRRIHPAVVFLDVQMPGCDGLQVLARLPPEERPAIILVTAHEQFAVDGFAEQVVDYLLKPFDRKRFDLALRRALDRHRSQRSLDLGAILEGVLSRSAPRPPDRLVVKAEGRLLFLRPDDIVWVEAASNYSTLHLVGAKRLLLRETLSSLEKRLGAARFARVNRSAIVHLDQVAELQPAKYGDYLVLLRNGARLPLSRHLRGRLEKFGAGT